ncbi:homeobox protein VENTX [Pituophis catenifer annectens]|uniref:homeobox protein VENTX n=1 Tax=Pituophis catenifer annectens TaxID=94852 RepID=UPI0039911190
MIIRRRLSAPLMFVYSSGACLGAAAHKGRDAGGHAQPGHTARSQRAMTKAPFSVEWLSQSSRPSSRHAQSRPEAKEAAPSEGGRAQQEDSPAGEKIPSEMKLVPSSQEPPPGPLPSLQKSRPPLPSSSTAASKMPWSTTECGSDGEGNFSECQTPDDGGSRNANTRRLRTAFSLEQISTLESSFKRHKYLGAAERRKLASKMQLSEVQIKTWFQNRRMKLKRQLQEMRPESSFHGVPFYGHLPFGPQSGPLSYVYSPPQQTFTRRDSSGIPFPPVPPPNLDPRNSSGGQPGAIWPMPFPYFVGYQDPRTVFMTL